MPSIKRGSFDRPTDHGSVTAVMTWFLTVASVLWVLVRVGTKLAISRKLANDDYLIFIALVRGLKRAIRHSAEANSRLSVLANALLCPYRSTMDWVSMFRHYLYRREPHSSR